ncbi:zinc finger protein 410 isoform X3 [Ambystoma mexicanum]
MLSDELESKPELLVQFVQNTSIPLGQSLEESASKDLSCLSLHPVTGTSQCSHLNLQDASANPHEPAKHVPSSILLKSVDVGHEAEESEAQCVQKPPAILSDSETASFLQYMQSSDSTSFILLNLTRAGLATSAENLMYVQDEAEDSGNDLFSSDSTDSSSPWFLRVQELAHDSLIAATRAQLAKSAKGTTNGENIHSCSGDAQPKEPIPTQHQRSEKKLKCSFEGCEKTFVWPAHFKYHLKTHRNDRSFACPKEGCGKSFYVSQRLSVHMRTHSGEKPFMCMEVGCGKQFTTAGNLKNHLRIHTGERPFMCEEEGCGRSFAENSSLRKHLLIHSGVKSHQCHMCGQKFSQSGSRNAHIRKYHTRIGAVGSGESVSASPISQQTDQETLHLTHHMMSLSTCGQTYDS